MGLGTLINALGVLAGGFVGMLIGHRISKNMQEAIMKAAAISVIFLGIIGACEHALRISENKVVSQGAMMLVVSLTLGTLIGELLNIERLFENLGIYLKKITNSDKDNRFVDSFIMASLTICIGAMSILGAIQDALFHDYSVLMAKTVLDGITILIFTAANGRGSIFSVVPLVIFQGGITVLAKFIEPIMTSVALTNLSLVGSVLIFCVGANIIWKLKIRIANMLPAIIIAVIFAFLPF